MPVDLYFHFIILCNERKYKLELVKAKRNPSNRQRSTMYGTFFKSKSSCMPVLDCKNFTILRLAHTKKIKLFLVNGSN